MIISLIARLIASLNANNRPGEVAAGVATGALLAMLPSGNLLWAALFVLAALVKLNLAIAIGVLVVASPFAPFGDQLFHSVGIAILRHSPLQDLFEALYALPLVPLTRFNNSIVMGSLVVGIAAWIPLFVVARQLTLLYRRSIHPRIAQSRIVRAFQRIPIVSRISGLVRRFSSVYRAVG